MGATDQTLTGSGVLTFLEVAKTGGDVLLPADFTLIDGTLTGSGLIKNTGGKLVFGMPNLSYTSDFAGSIDDVVLNHGTRGLTLSQNMVVNNTLLITSLGSITGSGGTTSS